MIHSPLITHWLGQVDYQQAWDKQKGMVVARHQDPDLPDELLLLEHPPTYTLGRSGKLENLLLDEAARAAEGLAVYHVDRGGDITYHGPGQLVGYPIFNLKRLHQATYGWSRPDLHRYLRDIEEVLIQTLSHFGVIGWRYPGYTGVWVTVAGEPLKLAAIGIKVSSRGISSHGFALNVNPDMGHFAGIIPCGISDHGVTSLSAILNRELTINELIPPVRKAFETLLQPVPVVAPPPSLT